MTGPTPHPSSGPCPYHQGAPGKRRGHSRPVTPPHPSLQRGDRTAGLRHRLTGMCSAMHIKVTREDGSR